MEVLAADRPFKALAAIAGASPAKVNKANFKEFPPIIYISFAVTAGALSQIAGSQPPRRSAMSR